MLSVEYEPVNEPSVNLTSFPARGEPAWILMGKYLVLTVPASL
jgi:hypothetical protein